MPKQEEKRISVRIPENYFQALEHSRKKLKVESISEVIRMLIGFYILPKMKEFEYENIAMITSGNKEIDLDSFHKLVERYNQNILNYLEYLKETEKRAKETISFTDKQFEIIEEVMKDEPQIIVGGYAKDYDIREGVAYEKKQT